jgi:hypothetical protein
MFEPAPSHPAADSNLLFGVLALQADLNDPGRFAEGCAAWSTRKNTPLAELLVERGWLVQLCLDKSTGNSSYQASACSGGQLARP